MVRINNEWVVDVDSLGNYSPMRDLHKKGVRKNKDGTETEYDMYSPAIGHYGNLASAIKAIAKETARKKMETATISLSDAVRAIEESNAQFESVLNKALHEKVRG